MHQFIALKKAAVDIAGGIGAVVEELVDQYKMDSQKLELLEKLQYQDAGAYLCSR